MYIRKFKVGNFKSYRESAEVEVSQGFNIIVGQNNAGKTALLEALSANFEPNPHRSVKTIPSPQASVDPVSWVEITFSLARRELLEVLAGKGDFGIAAPDCKSEFAFRVGHDRHGAENLESLSRLFFSQDSYEFKLRFSPRTTELWQPGRIPSFGLYPADPTGSPGQRLFVLAEVDRGCNPNYHGNLHDNDRREIGVKIGPLLPPLIYKFSAERYLVGECPVGARDLLAPNAANLPEVLSFLQANRQKFHEFNDLVNKVLPEVKWVSVRPVDERRVRILVWFIDPDTGRDDLAIPLNECGNGIGQVLAMLYVVASATRPQVILIDEPQSFLHPGATRKLIQVLADYPQHQYIIATHSPTVISAANASTILVTQFKDGESNMQQIDPAETKDLKTCLAEVGARLSDVFGADQILWVEGDTEELCFPIILNRIAKRSLLGTAIVAIRRTGELQGRDAEKIFDIYSRLGKSRSLLPPVVGFVFDRECFSTSDQVDLQRQSRDLVTFLPRRMYENYLLHPAAICAVVNEIAGFRDTPLTEDEVRTFLDTMRGDRTCYCSAQEAAAADDWEKFINGAKVLAELFNEFSETRVSFDKVKHDLALTEWLMENQPEELAEISELLVAMLNL